MRELWISFIGALIRFWDRRFAPPECFSCRILETEIARLRAENSSLIEKLLNPVVNEQSSELETISRFQVPWHVKKRELEKAHRQVSSTPVKASDLESFESALKELEG